MSLRDYQKKRNFKRTSEPSAAQKSAPSKNQSLFVIQKHDASHLHYDFRMEVKGVLKSWAVPKGPSLDPDHKRLAMMVEDHPYSYHNFEGRIPTGSYGAGEVIVWDTGTYTIDNVETKSDREKYVLEGIKKGKISFELHGQKLSGHFALVKMHDTAENAWLLIKELDDSVAKGDRFSDVSVLSDLQLTRDTNPDQASTKEVKAPRLSKLPDFFKPMLATLVDEPFTKPDWIYESKLDGYRALAFVDKSKVQLYSRNRILLNKKFPSIVKALAALPFQAVLDGEVVGLDEHGQVSFQILQNPDRHPDQLFYYVFDLPFIEGKDISGLPLTDRKKLLKKAIEGLPQVKFVEAVKDGQKLFQQAQHQGYEGIIAKKADSTYQAGVRSDVWLKIKITQQQEAIICGYTNPQGHRHHFGSLLLGVYQDGMLHYIGNTGTGFPMKELASLKKKLDGLKTATSPFNDPTSLPDKDVTWVKPTLVCEVKYAEWTQDNKLRQAVFQRLRSDKDPHSIVLEKPQTTRAAIKAAPDAISKATVHLSHLDKVYWPQLGLQKQDLIKYYEQVAPTILPYLLHRPQSLYRTPNGVNEPGFFQKDITFDVPDFVELVTIANDETGDTQYLVCNNKETLLYMANLGCIEINPWNSRVGSLDHPDYFVIDLDPVEIAFSAVVKVAQTVKKILDEAHITAFCKTSGKRGLHIFVPVQGMYETDLTATFAKLVATLTHQLVPEISSLERSPALRQGKVYIDFLQNRKGQTIAAPYSLRPTPEATASTPLAWKEVTKNLDPKKFTIKTLPKRIQKIGDVWEGLLTQSNDLQKALKFLQKMKPSQDK